MSHPGINIKYYRENYKERNNSLIKKIIMSFETPRIDEIDYTHLIDPIGVVPHFSYTDDNIIIGLSLFKYDMAKGLNNVNCLSKRFHGIYSIKPREDLIMFGPYNNILLYLKKDKEYREILPVRDIIDHEIGFTHNNFDVIFFLYTIEEGIGRFMYVKNCLSISSFYQYYDCKIKDGLFCNYNTTGLKTVRDIREYYIKKTILRFYKNVRSKFLR